MAHETDPQIRILRAPKEGLLSQDMINSTNVELNILKRRVDILMEEVASIRRGHNHLKKYTKRSLKEKLYDLFRKT